MPGMQGRARSHTAQTHCSQGNALPTSPRAQVGTAPLLRAALHI